MLTSILNECLRVTEEDTVAASSEVLVSGSSSSATTTAGGKSPTRTFPHLPVPKVQSISSVLSANLTQLLAVITNREEERDKLRQEVQKYREQVHRMHESQQLQQQRVDEQSSASSATATATAAEGDVSTYCPTQKGLLSSRFPTTNYTNASVFSFSPTDVT